MSNVSSQILQSILANAIFEKADKIFINYNVMYLAALMLLCYYEYGEVKYLETTSDIETIAENQLYGYDFLPNIEGYIKLGFKK